MRELETDYLVVGAGASGVAFVDALLTGAPDTRVVLVDRRHRPGGHWLDAYPFVRLHQPSANYGVASRPLGSDRIDTAGPNAGFYERATAPQICDHFGDALDEMVGSGRVTFLGLSDYRGSDGDGHRVISLLTGGETRIRARKFVDATYVESEIPSRRPPRFVVDDGVRLIPPNDLVQVAEPAASFTVIGAGKTAMDTCNWLLDAGVEPDSIRWIRPRDVWMFDRACMQPLDLVGGYMAMQAAWIEASAYAENGHDFAARLEAAGAFVRIDSNVRPDVFRGPIASQRELHALRSIERVVREQRILRIAPGRVSLTDGELTADTDEVFVDCTARGVPPTAPRPIFEGDRITLQYVTIGIVPWSAATIGTVEASGRDDVEKNRLCPPLAFSGDLADILELSHVGVVGINVRGAESDIGAWTDQCRLNPAAGAMARVNEPEIGAAVMRILTHIEGALENLARRAPRPFVPAARTPEATAATS